MVGKAWRACSRKWNGGLFQRGFGAQRSPEGERRCRRQGREGGVAQVEGDSNCHPIAIQLRSNRPNSTTPTRIVASNCPLFPQILCSDFSPNEQPHLAWPAATIPTACTPGHAPPSSHPQASAAICNLHPAGSFASQQPPKRASPAQATLFLPSNLLAPSHTSPWNSNPYALFYPSIPSVFPLFSRASERRVLLIVGVCQTFSHLHIFSSSHPHIFTSSHLHICSSSHLLTSSHPHILTASHLLIFTSSHLHIFSSSHTHIFTSSHPHILTSSHLLILTSSHLHILTSSHLLIFTSSRSLLPSCSCPLARSFFSFLFYFSLEGAGQCQRDGTKRNPFAPKTEVKLPFLASGRNPFARNAKNWGKIAISRFRRTLSHEMRFDRQKVM